MHVRSNVGYRGQSRRFMLEVDSSAAGVILIALFAGTGDQNQGGGYFAQ
jgi:hypothetical protein